MQRKDGKRRKRPAWLSHELVISPKHRKRAQRKWKLGYTAGDKYFSEDTKLRPRHKELQLARKIKRSEKEIYK